MYISSELIKFNTFWTASKKYLDILCIRQVGKHIFCFSNYYLTKNNCLLQVSN